MTSIVEIVMSMHAYRSWRDRSGWGIIAAILLASASGPAATACPNCGLDVVEEQKGGAGLKDGFTYSIIGLASMPFLVAAAAGGLIFRAYRGRGSTADAMDERG